MGEKLIIVYVMRLPYRSVVYNVVGCLGPSTMRRLVGAVWRFWSSREEGMLESWCLRRGTIAMLQ